MSADRSKKFSSQIALVALAALLIAGAASVIYLLLNQRLAPPIKEHYNVVAELKTANGVAPGLGQPVMVAGVKVGTISDTKQSNGKALVTLQIEKDQLPAVYENATAQLEPITALNDMRITLTPGDRSKSQLPSDGLLPLAQTTSPVQFDQLTGSLDADTRQYLQSLVIALGAGLKDNAGSFNQALNTLVPASRDLKRVSAALKRRRHSLKRLVTSLAAVSEEAASGNSVASLVKDAGKTLQAVSNNSENLNATLKLLPGTFKTTNGSLDSLSELSAQLQPAARELSPALKGLPSTLKQLESLSNLTATGLEQNTRPFIREFGQPSKQLSTIAKQLNPQLVPASQLLVNSNYILNELAYNPEPNNNSNPELPNRFEGLLHGYPWFFHNWNSVAGSSDAHGVISRATLMLNCQQISTVFDFSWQFRERYNRHNICKALYNE